MAQDYLQKKPHAASRTG